MIHHLSLGVSDIVRAGRFYDGCLTPLGYVRVWEDLEQGSEDQAIGYGLPGGGDKLCLKLRPGEDCAPGAGFHLAFHAFTRAAVDLFHASALALGGKDNGAPGVRAHYGPTYYAAFVIDLDGHRIEAVCKD